MSRIGRLPIPVPSGVKVELDGRRVSVKGPRGELAREFHPSMQVELVENELLVKRPDETRQNKALHGLTRSLLANMVTGVHEGFSKRLMINGVGYRADQRGRDVVLQIGFSHPVEIVPPEGVTLTVEQGGRSIVVDGNDKQVVGEVSAKIRGIHPPEPYKGKGIAYLGETIRRKAGKAGRVGG